MLTVEQTDPTAFAIAAIKAQALRDAADQLPTMYTRTDGEPAAWLRQRAERIENEARGRLSA